MSSLCFRPRTDAGQAYERAIDLLANGEASGANVTFARLEMSLAAHFFNDKKCIQLRDSLCADQKLASPWRLQTDIWANFKYDCRLQDPKTRTELQNTVDALVRYGLVDLALNLTALVQDIPDLSDATKAHLEISIAAQKITTKSALLLKIEECVNRVNPNLHEAKIYLEVGKQNGLFYPRQNNGGPDAVPVLHALGHLFEGFETVVGARSLSEIDGDVERRVRFIPFPLTVPSPRVEEV